MKQVSKKPKILFIAHTDNLRGGGELSAVELIKSAKHRGYQFHVVVPGFGDFSDAMRQIGVKSTAIEYSYWGRPYVAEEGATNTAAVGKIAALIIEQKIDCVVTNTLMIPWGALAAAMTNKPHIWITREKLNDHRSHMFENYDFIEAYSNVVFANSKDNASYLKTEIGIKNVRQFYSFVNPDNLRLNADFQKPRIINLAAHVRPSKNQLELVEALAELEKRKRLNIQTVFIARYSEKDEYFQKIKLCIEQNGLGDKVSFVGFHAEPFKLIGPDDIFARSSKYESLGRTITEAMKLGLKCAAADIDSSKEAFELGGGTLYKSGDPVDLANTLQEIIDKPEYYRKLAQKAKENALQNLSEKACNDPFFSELKKTLKEDNPRRELRHITSQILGMSEVLGKYKIEVDLQRNLAEQFKATAQEHKQTIQNIHNSKSWKLAHKISKARNVIRGNK